METYKEVWENCRFCSVNHIIQSGCRILNSVLWLAHIIVLLYQKLKKKTVIAFLSYLGIRLLTQWHHHHSNRPPGAFIWGLPHYGGGSCQSGTSGLYPPQLWVGADPDNTRRCNETMLVLETISPLNTKLYSLKVLFMRNMQRNNVRFLYTRDCHMYNFLPTVYPIPDYPDMEWGHHTLCIVAVLNCLYLPIARPFQQFWLLAPPSPQSSSGRLDSTVGRLR